MTNPTGCGERPQESGEKQEGSPDLPVGPHQLCQVPHSDLYFQNPESSALEGWRKVSCAFLEDASPPVLPFCSLSSCCSWQLLGEGGVVVPVFSVEFGVWYHQNLLLSCWRNDPGVKQLQKRVFASVCRRELLMFSQLIFVCVFVELKHHFLSNTNIFVYFESNINPCE